MISAEKETRRVGTMGKESALQIHGRGSVEPDISSIVPAAFANRMMVMLRNVVHLESYPPYPRKPSACFRRETPIGSGCDVYAYACKGSAQKKSFSSSKSDSQISKFPNVDFSPTCTTFHVKTSLSPKSPSPSRLSRSASSYNVLTIFTFLTYSTLSFTHF